MTRVIRKLEQPAGARLEALEYTFQTMYRKIPQNVFLYLFKQFEN